MVFLAKLQLLVQQHRWIPCMYLVYSNASFHVLHDDGTGSFPLLDYVVWLSTRDGFPTQRIITLDLQQKQQHYNRPSARHLAPACPRILLGHTFRTCSTAWMGERSYRYHKASPPQNGIVSYIQVSWSKYVCVPCGGGGLCPTVHFAFF